ncbi:lead, cadmium, zinc and mercury transporting ATPase [Psychrobacter sp. JCM 18901]|nr:lead, cadmium, zinc and mercury transporting ATPase [Psychrobacter sp. JCM 18901]
MTETKPIELSIEGMSCASCVGRVEKSLAKVAGVQQATVNLATERAWIKGDAQIKTSELIEAVKKSGLRGQTGRTRPK